MNHAWDDLPEELWWALHQHALDYLDTVGQYMWDHHACYYVNAGSRVNSCDSLALPGSDYCVRHGNFD